MTPIPAFQADDGLLLVDPQNDFCPGGALPVVEGDRVMPVLSAWAAAAERAGIPIFVSRDWHPLRTTHFKDYGGVWPVHCVQGTPGAEFHHELKLPPSALIASKGMGETEDAYSAFQARDERGRLLGELVRQRGVRHLYVMGLATDYCVKDSVLAAVSEGLAVSLVAHGVRAVNLEPNDGAAAMAEMQRRGGLIVA